jgi:hypothetical protein
MQIRQEWKQPVEGKQGAFAILIAVLLLSGIGIMWLKDGHVPTLPTALWGVGLALVWGRTLWDWGKYGKQAFPFWRCVYMAGSSAFFGGHLLAGGAVREWIIGIGIALIMTVFGLSIFDLRGKR